MAANRTRSSPRPRSCRGSSRSPPSGTRSCATSPRRATTSPHASRPAGPSASSRASRPPTRSRSTAGSSALYWTLGRSGSWSAWRRPPWPSGRPCSRSRSAPGLPARAGLVAGLVVALHPYLVWHDVHLNREVLDTFLVAAITLAALWAAERRTTLASPPWGRSPASRSSGTRASVLLPLVLAGWLLWRGVPLARSGAVLLAAAVVVMPWVVRNEVQVGCATITTDAKALWKANNLAYLRHARARRLDRRRARSAGRAADAGGRRAGVGRTVDECAQMRLYRELTTEFWREHPGEKARLAAQAVRNALEPTRHADGRGPRRGRLPRHRTGVGAAVVRRPALRARALGLRARAAAGRRPLRADARVRDADRDGVRRGDALPRPVGPAARRARGCAAVDRLLRSRAAR